MSFADLVNKCWNDGINPVKEGVMGIMSKAKGHDEIGRDSRTQENEINMH